MNASRSVTSFTSITTSDNGRDKHAKGPFVHVIHGPAAPAHKSPKRSWDAPARITKAITCCSSWIRASPGAQRRQQGIQFALTIGGSLGLGALEQPLSPVRLSASELSERGRGVGRDVTRRQHDLTGAN